MTLQNFLHIIHIILVCCYALMVSIGYVCLLTCLKESSSCQHEPRITALSEQCTCIYYAVDGLQIQTKTTTWGAYYGMLRA